MRKRTEPVVIVGLVEAENDGGYKVDGKWYNVSKFADDTKFPLTARGKRVRLTLDSAGFVRGVDVLDSDGATTTTTSGAVDYQARRDALQLAVALVGYLPAADPKQDPTDYLVAETLTIASALLEWLEGKP